jgi:hypothetical protein
MHPLGYRVKKYGSENCKTLTLPMGGQNMKPKTLQLEPKTKTSSATYKTSKIGYLTERKMCPRTSWKAGKDENKELL